MTFPAGGGFPMGTADAVAGWDFEIGTFGPRTTSQATSASGDGMVLWCMSLMPMEDLTASGALAPDVLLSFSHGESNTVADVERRAPGGAWAHVGFSDVDAGEYLDVAPGSGTWQYRVRAAGGDYELNPSRSAYSATVQVTI